MKGTITFTREALDKYTARVEEVVKNGHSTFVWKGKIINVNEA